MASISLARKYPNATIVAVEPEGANVASLAKNTAPYPNIKIIHAAIWNTNGEVTLGKSNAHPLGAFQIVESAIS